MTEYTSSNRIIGTLIQIKEAIKQLQDWNKDVQTVDDYYCTPEGMKKQRYAFLSYLPRY